jgi:hypothetical protein
LVTNGLSLESQERLLVSTEMIQQLPELQLPKLLDIGLDLERK